MATNKDIKHKGAILIIGLLLLSLSFILYNYETILEVNNELKNNIESEIYKENTNYNQLSINIDVDYLEEENILENEISENKTEYKPNYIAFLKIEKLNLNQGLYPKTSYYNNVDYNLEILDLADFPDKEKGNFLIAGHSGNSNVSYFKNLYKLLIGDKAKVYYNGKVYNYQIVNIYDVLKTGSITINRDLNKTTMTFITCTKGDKTKQTIYILELIGVETY